MIGDVDQWTMRSDNEGNMWSKELYLIIMVFPTGGGINTGNSFI